VVDVSGATGFVEMVFVTTGIVVVGLVINNGVVRTRIIKMPTAADILFN